MLVIKVLFVVLLVVQNLFVFHRHITDYKKEEVDTAGKIATVIGIVFLTAEDLFITGFFIYSWFH